MTAPPRFRAGVAWMAAGNWIEQALNLAVFLLLARLIGAEAFGRAAMAMALVILAEFLVRETLTEGLIARDSVPPAELDRVFRALALLALALALALVLAAPLIARAYGAPEVAGLVAGFAPAVLLVGLSAVPVALLRRAMRFELLGRRAILGVVLGGAAGLGLALAGAGPWSLVGQRLVQVGVNAALAWGGAGWRPGLGPLPGARPMPGSARLGGATLVLRAGQLLALQTPAVLLGAFAGPAAAGQFAAAWRLVEIIAYLLSAPLAAVAQPAFAALRREGGDAALLLARLMGLLLLLAPAAFAGLALVAEPLAALLLGPAWAGTGPVLALLCLAGAWSAVERLQQAFLLASGAAGGLARLALAEFGLGIPMMLAALPLGTPAVAAAFGLRYLLLWPLRFRLVSAAGGPGGRAALALLLPALPGLLLMAAGVLLVLGATAAGGLPAAPRLALAILLGAAIFLLYAGIALPERLAALRALLAGREPGDPP
jgi:PST family polysaccharide transporter